jgi:tRNA-specific 2-thiouridylase
MAYLRVGRHFRLKGGAKVVAGRNQFENGVLQSMVQDDERILEAEECVGPIVVLRSIIKDEDVVLAARICARYCDARNLATVKVRAGDARFEVRPLEDEELGRLRVG